MRSTQIIRALGAGLLSSLLSLGSGPPARAQTVLATTLGPAETFSTSNFVGVTGEAYIQGQTNTWAVRFAVPSDGDYSFTKARLALNYGFGSPNLGRLSLRAHNVDRPGTELESVSISPLPASPSLIQWNAGGGTTLAAGQTYWLMAEAAQDAALKWWASDAGPFTGSSVSLGNMHNNYNGDTWAETTFTPAFEVSGSRLEGSGQVVPEPGSLLLFLPGLAAVALRRRRGRTAGSS